MGGDSLQRIRRKTRVKVRRHKKEIYKGLFLSLLPRHERARLKKLLDEQNLIIIYGDWGTANRFNNYIEVHRKLLDYPNLYYPIIRHELEHTEKQISTKDFLHDVKKIPALKETDLIKFIFKTRGALKQLLPIYYDKANHTIIYDPVHLIIYSVVLLIPLSLLVLILLLI